MKECILLIFICAGFMACKGQDFNYDLATPDRELKLDKELNEVSGLAWLKDSIVLAVQDEKANIYYLNIDSGEIIKKVDFGKNADYEGVTSVDERIYILRSDGNLFKFKKGKETKEYNFKNSKNFDFEGLAADALNNRLLVACKTHGEGAEKDYFFIYSFSLATKKYDKNPLFRIKKDRINRRFKPSGIAIGPEGNYYILSSVSKTLLVLTPKGGIVNNITLDASIFHQPEGITFTEDGALLISNEKKDKKPNILMFNSLSTGR